ncbi:MAG: YebC/PmpR family DNA-binding transcriptional regulator [Peptococcaceae bacterium]|jgi:YebC/PmpR family DNA-binding regulatory protein|nr:YebC/PmpR family DNA-binding transcriptional regulator [Peptococcaceae bacterium]
MSGHSKWANIKHKKGRQDAAKGKVFTKVGRELIVAARAGGANPDANFRLKIAIQKAKACNMPADNIQRAIQKGAGAADGSNYEELTYEGYGPGGVAVMVNIMTDNRNRTAGEIRHIFSKNGGNMGETGCVGWMFKEKGLLTVASEDLTTDADDLMLTALDAGAEDIQEQEDAFEIMTAPEDFQKVKDQMEAGGVVFSEAEIMMIPETTVEITDPEQAKLLLRLMDYLEDHDDVQNTYTNLDIDEEIVAGLS